MNQHPADSTRSCYDPGHNPTLVVDYNSSPGTPSGLTWTPRTTHTAESTTTTYTNTLTPTFSAKVSDPDRAVRALSSR